MMLKVETTDVETWFSIYDAWGTSIATDDDQEATKTHNDLIEATGRLAKTKVHSDAALLGKLEAWVQDNIDNVDELYERQLSDVVILSVIRDLASRSAALSLRPHTLRILQSMNSRIAAHNRVVCDNISATATGTNDGATSLMTKVA